MKPIYISSLFIAVLLLAACNSAPTPTPLPTVLLDTAASNSAPNVQSVGASAEVKPMIYAELSFPIAGIVKSVEVAAGDRVTAGQPLVTLDAAILEARVKEAEANVVTAQTDYRYLYRIGASQEQLDAKLANVDRARATLEIAKAQLAQATLAAPFDGTIASVDISPAEYVSPGQIVVMMGDLSQMQVETTDLSEKDVVAVEAGVPATVYIEALDQEFSGRVIDIARRAQKIGGDVVYKVTIKLDQQPAGLRWGMSAEVNIRVK